MTTPALPDTTRARAFAGYQAYSTAVGHRTHRGDRMPRFHELPPRTRAAYVQAATLASVGGATGEDAFGAYLETNGPLAYTGRKTPAWPDLTETIRSAWQAFADAAAVEPVDGASDDDDPAPATPGAGV